MTGVDVVMAVENSATSKRGSAICAKPNCRFRSSTRNRAGSLSDSTELPGREPNGG
jgi:predicted outer membrane repeat protein